MAAVYQQWLLRAAMLQNEPLCNLARLFCIIHITAYLGLHVSVPVVVAAAGFMSLSPLQHDQASSDHSSALNRLPVPANFPANVQTSNCFGFSACFMHISVSALCA
jgi:hypothetical protein